MTKFNYELQMSQLKNAKTIKLKVKIARRVHNLFTQHLNRPVNHEDMLVQARIYKLFYYSVIVNRIEDYLPQFITSLFKNHTFQARMLHLLFFSHPYGTYKDFIFLFEHIEEINLTCPRGILTFDLQRRLVDYKLGTSRESLIYRILTIIGNNKCTFQLVYTRSRQYLSETIEAKLLTTNKDREQAEILALINIVEGMKIKLNQPDNTLANMIIQHNLELLSIDFKENFTKYLSEIEEKNKIIRQSTDVTLETLKKYFTNS